MKINEYIQHRYNLEQLDINVLNETDYKNENSDYKNLLEISNRNPLELPISLGDRYILWFYIFIGFTLSIVFSMGYSYEMRYSDKIHNVINITMYVLFVITIPLSIFIGSFLYKIYSKFLKKVKSNWYEKFIDDLFKINFFAKQKEYLKEYLKEVIKITSFFYFNIISISYSVFSIIWLLYFTGTKKYAFFWDSTWISTKIIKGYSIIIEAINSNLIPISLRQESISDSPIFDATWLWFLIVLTIVWIIIPKIVLLIFNKYKVEKKLNYSFVNNSKSKIILNVIHPITSTTEPIVGQSKKVNKTNISSKIIKLDLSNKNTSNFRTFLLWHLCEEAILNMRNNLNNTNIDLIVLKSARELNLENIRKESSLLIIINVDNTPQGKFIRLLERVSEFNITIKFIDEKGEFTNSNKNIGEWSRFLEENNITIEVTHE